MKKKKSIKNNNGMKQKIAAEVGKAINGSEVLKLTFKKFEGIKAVTFFLALRGVGVIKMSDNTTSILDAAMRKKMWACKENCTIIFSIGEDFNLELFIENMVYAIKDIEAVE